MDKSKLKQIIRDIIEESNEVNSNEVVVTIAKEEFFDWDFWSFMQEFNISFSSQAKNKNWLLKGEAKRINLFLDSYYQNDEIDTLSRSSFATKTYEATIELEITEPDDKGLWNAIDKYNIDVDGTNGPWVTWVFKGDKLDIIDFYDNYYDKGNNSGMREEVLGVLLDGLEDDETVDKDFEEAYDKLSTFRNIGGSADWADNAWRISGSRAEGTVIYENDKLENDYSVIEYDYTGDDEEESHTEVFNGTLQECFEFVGK